MSRPIWPADQNFLNAIYSNTGPTPAQALQRAIVYSAAAAGNAAFRRAPGIGVYPPSPGELARDLAAVSRSRPHRGPPFAQEAGAAEVLQQRAVQVAGIQLPQVEIEPMALEKTFGKKPDGESDSSKLGKVAALVAVAAVVGGGLGAARATKSRRAGGAAVGALIGAAGALLGTAGGYAATGATNYRLE